MARTLFQEGQEPTGRVMAHFHDTVMEALRHLRLALGTGFIFYGFDVREEPPGLLAISPGLAFDGAGQPVALDSTLPLPLPPEDGPLWLCLRHHLLVDERDAAGRAVRERDSVEVVWLASAPRNDEMVPIARLHRGPSAWHIDRSMARRAPTLSHRHTGETVADRSGRLRFDGYPVRLTAPGGEEQKQAIQRLESAAASEFTKVHFLLEDLGAKQSLHALAVDELRTEVAEVAERAINASRSDQPGEDALAALREELSLTVGEELREELDLLRVELKALAQRPASMAGDLGSFTSIAALHGVGEAFAQKLRGAGIETVSDLLAAAGSAEARELVESTGIGQTRLKRWCREADLLRLHGVGPGEVSLLDTVGITSTDMLGRENGRDLFERLRVAASDRGDVSSPPLSWVESWVEQAKHLPPVSEW